MSGRLLKKRCLQYLYFLRISCVQSQNDYILHRFCLYVVQLNSFWTHCKLALLLPARTSTTRCKCGRACWIISSLEWSYNTCSCWAVSYVRVCVVWVAISTYLEIGGLERTGWPCHIVFKLGKKGMEKSWKMVGLQSEMPNSRGLPPPSKTDKNVQWAVNEVLIGASHPDVV